MRQQSLTQQRRLHGSLVVGVAVVFGCLPALKRGTQQTESSDDSVSLPEDAKPPPPSAVVVPANDSQPTASEPGAASAVDAAGADAGNPGNPGTGVAVSIVPVEDTTPPTIGPIRRSPADINTFLGGTYTFSANVSDDVGVSRCLGSFGTGDVDNQFFTSVPSPVRIENGVASATFEHFFGFEAFNLLCTDAAGNAAMARTAVPSFQVQPGLTDNTPPVVAPVVASSATVVLGTPFDLYVSVRDDTGVLACDTYVEDTTSGARHYYKLPTQDTQNGTFELSIAVVSEPGFLESGAGSVRIYAYCYDGLFNTAQSTPTIVTVVPASNLLPAATPGQSP